MHSFAALTVFAATFSALANGVPLAHGPKHQRLHAPRALAAAGPEVLKLVPVIAVRQVETVQLDLNGGTCGGSTGFGCAAGFCCSKWGYCGQSAAYCGDGAGVTNSSAPSGEDLSAAGWPGHGQSQSWGPPSTYNPPASSLDLPANTPPAYSSPAENSAAPVPASPSEAPAPAPTSYEAPAPSSYSAPSSVAQAPPSSYAPAPAPSSYAAPQPSSSPSSGGSGLGDVYKMYNGDGAASSGWPSEDQWASFDSLWTANEPTMKISCSQFGQQDPSDQEIADTKSAIASVAASSGVDSRFILAIMMQESKGCVRVPTTSWSHANPGLFQSFQGTGSCNPDGTGIVPCPASTITQMVRDGVEGTASGPGLKQNIAQCTASGAQKYYEAARIYNAGSLVGDNLGAPGATECYCSDVANRLTGWTTASTACTL